MIRPTVLPAILVSLCCLACLGPRKPGPLEREYGDVIFWEVTSIETSQESCTNAADLEAATTPPPLRENTFFMYEVSDDGSTATTMDCTENRASSCTEVQDQDFSVEGHRLVWTAEPQNITSGTSCGVLLGQAWVFQDGGEEATIDVLMAFEFDGEPAACEVLDDDIANSGTNGDGLMNCEVLLTADMVFSNVD